MIRYSDEEGFIKAQGLKFREGQDKNIVLPKVAVGVFSKSLFEDIIEKFRCMEVGYLSMAGLQRNIYIMKYKDTELTIFNAGVSGPWISADIEELSVSGVQKFIIFGNCGVLDANIEDCSIIIPTKAFREDGTSYHYVKDSETIDLNSKYVDDFIEVLNNRNFSYTKGYTWTIDAFYRETREKINYFKKQGVVCVEMEGATIASVCQRKNLEYFTFYYAGDNLDAVEWDERSLFDNKNLDKKKEVVFLALDLALKINSK